MDKVFLIVFHLFTGDAHNGEILKAIAHPFQTEELCRSWITSAMKTYDYDKGTHRNFYVDCMLLDDLPPTTPLE